jgi:hypothetical protein
VKHRVDLWKEKLPMEENNLSLTDIVFREMSKILLPLQNLNSKERVTDLLLELGWELPNKMMLDVSFPNLLENVNLLNNAVYAIEAADTTQDRLIKTISLIDAIKSTVDVIYEARTVLSSALDQLQELKEFKETSGIVEEFPIRLLDYLVSIYLQSFYPKGYSIIVLAGLLEDKQNSAFYRIIWDRLPLIFSDPKSLLNKTYDWDTDFKGKDFLRRLDLLMRAFLIPGGMYNKSQTIDDVAQPVISEELRIPIYQESIWPEKYEEAGINISLLPKIDDNNLSGLAITPYVFGTDRSILDLTNRWVLDFSGNASLEKNLSITIRPPNNIELTPGSFDLSEHSFKVEIKERKELIRKLLILGSENASHFSVEGIKLSVLASQVGQSKDYASQLNIEKISLVIAKGDEDGFLAKLLPEKPLEIDGNLILGFSSKKGFYISGGAGLGQNFEYTFQVQKSLGPIFIETFDLGLSTKDNLALVTAVSGTASIGPVKASLIKIGMKTTLDFSKPGLLGNADLSMDFKPPEGVGLEIDANIVKGGGGLIVENGNYSGWLDLEINKKIRLQAICIITTTRSPDGLKTFSFKILGFAEFPAVQIGFGFSISGVGLAIAINCRMNEERLRGAVYDGSLSSLLFPTNLAENASQIIGAIKEFFPEQENTYIIGAMAKLGWGAGEPIITADVGIFLEFGTGLRIALAGIGCANLPNAQSPFLCLRFQVLGLIDFNNKTFSIDATINGSRLMEWALDGSMALRSSWGDKKRFALSIGGFYPGYKPPDGFPSLDRISLAIGTGNPKIQLLCYLAITENSVQIGAALILYWHKKYDWPVGHIEVDGAVGFDALFQFSPFFSFETKFYAAFCLKRNGDSFMSVDLRLRLSGPNNYHAVGKAKVEICRVGVTVEFDKEFGSKRLETKKTVNPIEILIRELENEKNWFVRRLEDQDQDTILLDEERAPEVTERVEPLGTICFKQRAIPLQISIEKIGNADSEGNERFLDIKSDAGKKDEDIFEFFAPGEFEELSDEEKISAPAFEEMKCGIAITGGNEIECKFDSIHTRNVEHELKLPDTVSPSDGGRRFSPCFKTPALERMILTTGRNLHTNKPSLLKEFDKADSFEVKEQKVATIDDSFHASTTPTTYAQTRQEYKKNGGANTISYIIDSARARNN